MNENELLTPSEMAMKLKVNKSWLYRKTMETGAGAIPRLKMGKYLRFDPDKVFQWIENQNAVQAA